MTTPLTPGSPNPPPGSAAPPPWPTHPAPGAATPPPVRVNPAPMPVNPPPVRLNLPPGQELLALERLGRALNGIPRWRLLRELAKGEALPVAELARRVATTGNMTSKHLGILRDAGLVDKVYGQLYRLAPRVRVDHENRLLDLGHCLLRLDVPM